MADGLGHVYVSTGTLNSVPYSITKYDINGNVLQTFNISDREFHSLAIDLGPDQCSIYYGSWGAPGNMINRLNACTSTTGTPFNWDSFVDDLRVLPDGRVIALDDSYAQLYDASGQTILQKYTAPIDTDALRTMSLDPDGSSVWLCCGAGRSGAAHVYRFDIASGQLLSDWSPSGTAAGSIAVYGPPLVGDADVAARSIQTPPVPPRRSRPRRGPPGSSRACTYTSTPPRLPLRRSSGSTPTSRVTRKRSWSRPRSAASDRELELCRRPGDALTAGSVTGSRCWGRAAAT